MIPNHHGLDLASGSLVDHHLGQSGASAGIADASRGPAANASPVWTQLTLQGTTPPGNYGESVYDPAAGYTLFLDSQGSTWSYLTGRWSNITASLDSSPPARFSAVMVYDTQLEGVLLFGGLALGTADPLDDTWEFSGGQWHNLTSSLAESPPAAGEVIYDTAPISAAYDSHTNSVVLLDGPQTWVFNNSQWSPVSTAISPGSRSVAGMADDPADQDVVLFGGVNISTGSYVNDTWSFNGSDWTRLHPTFSPPAEGFVGFAYFPPGGYPLLAGGDNATGAVGGVWKFTAGSWEAIPSSSRPFAPLAALTFDAHDGYAFLINQAMGGGNAFWVYGPPLGEPEVSISAVPTSGAVPLNVSFRPTVSGGQSPYIFSWVLRGEPISREIGTSEDANYTFNFSGTFEVYLTVTDVYGQHSSAFTNVTVLAVPTAPSFPSGWNTVELAILTAAVLGTGILVAVVYWRVRGPSVER